MRKRPWLALAAVFGALMPLAAPAQPQKPRPQETMGQRVARESKLTEEQVNRVLNALGPAMRDEIIKGRSVSLPGLGTFRVVRVGEHKDIEAGTGRPLRVPARNTVEFLASDGLGDAANGPAVVPAETVPGFQYNPLLHQTPGQKVPQMKTEGSRTP
jgi:nucleoid DNA-binding protein